MLILGIDPGSSGGLAIVESKVNSLPKIIWASKMPVVNVFSKKIIDVMTVSAYVYHSTSSMQKNVEKKDAMHYL